MAKLTLAPITASRGSKDLLNSNSSAIEVALENTLSLDGTSPNAMTSDFDMNGQNILNLSSLEVGGIDIGLQATAAQASAAAALVSETNAGVSETNSAASAVQTASDVITVQDQKLIWQGAYVGGTTYSVNDAVLSSGTSYICTATTTGNTPPNVSYWDVLAQQGSAGAGTGDMLSTNNLSDVTNVSTARSNLGISATNTPNTASGNIVATNVQAAINELDTEKEPSDATIVKDADIGVTVQAYDVDIATVSASQVEMEGGTEAVLRSMSPLRVAQAIAALASGGIFTETFTSAAQTITSAGGLTIAHGLTSVPTLVQLRLRNITADAGYSTGEEVIINGNSNDNGSASNRGQSVWLDATNINIRFGSSATPYVILHKTSGAATVLTNARWSLLVKVWS